jgi:tetratricopeptide (TPR) repeat protein
MAQQVQEKSSDWDKVLDTLCEANALRGFAKLNFSHKNYLLAWRAYSKYIQSFSDDLPTILTNKALVACKLEVFEQARHDAIRALELIPHNNPESKKLILKAFTILATADRALKCPLDAIRIAQNLKLSDSPVLKSVLQQLEDEVQAIKQADVRNLIRFATFDSYPWQKTDTTFMEASLEYFNRAIGGQNMDIEVRYVDEKKGRGVFALRSFEVGEVIWQETASVSVDNLVKPTCYHCTKKILAEQGVPCRCPEVGFCSPECRDVSFREYHHQWCCRGSCENLICRAQEGNATSSLFGLAVLKIFATALAKGCSPLELDFIRYLQPPKLYPETRVDCDAYFPVYREICSSLKCENKPGFDYWVFVYLVRILEGNAFGWTDKKMYDGLLHRTVCLYSLGSMFNHDCVDPNCTISVDEPLITKDEDRERTSMPHSVVPRRVKFIASEFIAAGSEVCIKYVKEDPVDETAYMRLRYCYGIDSCKCFACSFFSRRLSNMPTEIATFCDI